MRAFDTNEVLTVGVVIRVSKKTVVPEKYKAMFHGLTTVPKGRYVYTYPIKNPGYSRRINELERWYGMDIQYGLAGSAEV